MVHQKRKEGKGVYSLHGAHPHWLTHLKEQALSLKTQQLLHLEVTCDMFHHRSLSLSSEALEGTCSHGYVIISQTWAESSSARTRGAWRVVSITVMLLIGIIYHHTALIGIFSGNWSVNAITQHIVTFDCLFSRNYRRSFLKYLMLLISTASTLQFIPVFNCKMLEWLLIVLCSELEGWFVFTWTCISPEAFAGMWT